MCQGIGLRRSAVFESIVPLKSQGWSGIVNVAWSKSQEVGGRSCKLVVDDPGAAGRKSPYNATAKSLFERLQSDYPGKFGDGQLRTLQRRIGEWRAIMARKLIYATLDLNNNSTAVAPIGTEKLELTNTATEYAAS